VGAFIFITAVIFDSAYCIPFLFLANIDNISLIPDISTSGESIMTSKSTSTRFYETALSYSQGTHFYSTLQGTNISPKNGILKMIFLFPRWDMLIPWRVIITSLNSPKHFDQHFALTCLEFTIETSPNHYGSHPAIFPGLCFQRTSR